MSTTITRISRIYGDERDLEFKIDLTEYYAKYGLDGSDIEDIIWVVKSRKLNPDNNLLMRRLSDGQISFVQAIEDGRIILNVVVTWPADEYDQFQPRRKYAAGLYPKFTGDAAADENTEDEFEVVILQDTLQNN